MVTSSEVVRRIKSKFKLDKVGHCGTLDPFAEGVLLIVTGCKTSESNKYMDSAKSYRATISLGKQTDTLDHLGEVIKIQNDFVGPPSETEIKKILTQFNGRVMQRPPAFSAKKINGVRLYKLARDDVFVHLKPVPVQINSISLVTIQDNELTIDVECSKGTYIRQLGLDIARSMGTYGYLSSLTRTGVGSFDSSNCFDFRDIDSWNSTAH